MQIKKHLSALLAVTLIFGVTACGNSSSKGDSSYTETIEVATTDKIEAIADGAESELEWFSYFDLNPTKTSPEKSANVALFEQKGGKIKYTQTTSLTRYDDLAARLMSNDPPDMFWYETAMTFPANCIKGMFQPVDSIIDFDDAMWADVKETAEQYTLRGEHYVAPVGFGALSVLTYDKDVITANGLDDPYEMYQNGEWDWDAWFNLMEEFCSEGDNRYGVNGWFAPFFFQSTGKTLIQYDANADEYVSNVMDPELERAAGLLYEVQKKGYYNSEWIASARQAFNKNVLFYAMGTWAVSPKEGDNWAIVPMPRDPNTEEKYVTLGLSAYMWVKGSSKNEAMKCWMECSKIAETGEEYQATKEEKFRINQPYWTDEMYSVVYDDLLSGDFKRMFDPGYGISIALSDDNAATNPSKEAIVQYMYSSVMKSDEDDHQFTWAELRETYKATIDSELKTFNQAYHEFKAE